MDFTAVITVNAFYLNVLFPQFSLAPSNRDAQHYLLTPYLNTPSEGWKNQLFLVYESALKHPLFSISMYGAAVRLRGDLPPLSAPHRQLSACTALIH